MNGFSIIVSPVIGLPVIVFIVFAIIFVIVVVAIVLDVI